MKTLHTSIMTSNTSLSLPSRLTTPLPPDVWTYYRLADGSEPAKGFGGRVLHYCLSCPRNPYSTYHSGNAIKHINAKHLDIARRLNSRLSLPPPSTPSQPSITSFLTTLPAVHSTITLRESFDYQAYNRALISLITRRRLPFSTVE
ncbi:hypothetical protein K402DRAFT_431903 [Aulographum hederae CBS 113979]|uniref:BED-type domain-containing protein n=1 Tax=Aulographum hederae CBS 113979 TaxID=1176131 RepID=A0A6G1GZ18_9PEZI|nr:hypothetical protein K402DRAFT_431903 [Aulographum hederae CBS 113979]